MDFALLENEEEEDEEDVDLQYMIEQSLLECGQLGDFSESAPVEERRYAQ